MFPWQSGSDGTEETQIVHLNPLSGQWDPDHSHNQRHVAVDISPDLPAARRRLGLHDMRRGHRRERRDQVRHTTWHAMLAAALLPPDDRGSTDDPPADR
jgi:hypothetical protein